jgi:hypothetical protein
MQITITPLHCPDCQSTKITHIYYINRISFELYAKEIIESNSISSYYNHIFRKNRFIRNIYLLHQPEVEGNVSRRCDSSVRRSSHTSCASTCCIRKMMDSTQASYTVRGVNL